MIKIAIRSLFELFYKKDSIQKISLRTLIQIFIFQKILRINGSVPWPVHFSSIVGPINKIMIKDVSTCPGITPGCYIQAMNGIEFGENVLVGPGVKIISANHDPYDYNKHIKTPPIIIGDNVWIGANAVLLPGVEIGNNVIIGAGTIVTKSLKSNATYAGNPAKMIRGQ